VDVSRRVRAGSVELNATRGRAVPRGTRVEVQLHLLCAKGPS
jgi:hypothetical protein